MFINESVSSWKNYLLIDEPGACECKLDLESRNECIGSSRAGPIPPIQINNSS